MVLVRSNLNNTIKTPPKNAENHFIELNYDKGSNKAKVSISSLEFTGEAAKLLYDIALGAEKGIGFGVPFIEEIRDKEGFEVTLDGVVDLTNHELLSCRKVIAPVIERGGNDFIEKTFGRVSFEFIFNRRPDLLDKTKFKYVPYTKNRFDNLELANALFTLVGLIIQIQQAIEGLIGVLGELVAFSWEKLVRIVIYAIYIYFLLRAVIELTQAILDMIIAPVKYHAGMSVLELAQIGCEYFGYSFSSTIFEGDLKKMVIIPPKSETIEDDNNNLITGFTQPNEDEQVGYYDGSVEQFFKDIIALVNGKIIIEEASTPTGKKTVRLEREDFNNSQELYVMPDIDNDGRLRLNSTENKAVRKLQFLTDSKDINTFQNYTGNNITEILEVVDIDSDNLYTNLLEGFETTTIPFVRGIAKTENSRTEIIVGEVLDILSPLVGEMVFIYNSQTYRKWQESSFMISQINTILTAAGFDNIENPFQTLEELPLISIPNFQDYIGNRLDVMLLESDYTTIHRLVMLEEGYTVSLSSESETKLGQFALDHDFPFVNEELIDVLSGVEKTGEAFQNKLAENNNDILNAKYFYENHYGIRSFLSTKDRPLGNQWKLLENEVGGFCLKDYRLLKNDNKFKDSKGNTCELLSLKWYYKANKAQFIYRENFNYWKNLQLKDGELLESVSK